MIIFFSPLYIEQNALYFLVSVSLSGIQRVVSELTGYILKYASREKSSGNTTTVQSIVCFCIAWKNESSLVWW